MKEKLDSLLIKINELQGQPKLVITLLNEVIPSISSPEELSAKTSTILSGISKLMCPKETIYNLTQEFNTIIAGFGEKIEIPKNKFNIRSLKKYDIIFAQSQTEPQKHYHVVIGKSGGLVYTICITSKQLFGRINITKSRMFKGGYFVPNFHIFQEDLILANFYAIYDSKKEIDNTIKEIKEQIIKL